jgi:hypothetical protein
MQFFFFPKISMFIYTPPPPPPKLVEHVFNSIVAYLLISKFTSTTDHVAHARHVGVRLLFYLPQHQSKWQIHKWHCSSAWRSMAAYNWQAACQPAATNQTAGNACE